MRFFAVSSALAISVVGAHEHGGRHKHGKAVGHAMMSACSSAAQCAPCSFTKGSATIEGRCEPRKPHNGKAKKVDDGKFICLPAPGAWEVKNKGTGKGKAATSSAALIPPPTKQAVEQCVVAARAEAEGKFKGMVAKCAAKRSRRRLHGKHKGGKKGKHGGKKHGGKKHGGKHGSSNAGVVPAAADGSAPTCEAVVHSKWSEYCEGKLGGWEMKKHGHPRVCAYDPSSSLDASASSGAASKRLPSGTSSDGISSESTIALGVLGVALVATLAVAFLVGTALVAVHYRRRRTAAVADVDAEAAAASDAGIVPIAEAVLVTESDAVAPTALAATATIVSDASSRNPKDTKEDEEAPKLANQ